MNRAARRAARKGGAKPSRRVNKAAAAYILDRTIVAGSMEPAPQATVNLFAIPTYSAVDLLSRGQLTVPEYIRLLQNNYIGAILGKMVFDSGTEAVKLAIGPRLYVFEDAAEGIARAGDRYRKHGRFGVSGDDLKSIREAVALLDELVSTAPQGFILRATAEAARQIDSM